MNLRQLGRLLLCVVALSVYAAPPVMAATAAAGQGRKVRVTGVVRDESNNITLPGLPVEVVGGETVFARTGKIRVIRSSGGEATVHYVNLNAIRAGDLRTNIVLASGDIVYVPANVFALIGYAMNSLLLRARTRSSSGVISWQNPRATRQSLSWRRKKQVGDSLCLADDSAGLPSPSPMAAMHPRSPRCPSGRTAK